MIPVLFITYNRLEYTKRAIEALCHSDAGNIHILDNNSSDGTREWLMATFEKGDPFGYYRNRQVSISYQDKNLGIAGALNMFLGITKNYRYVAKIDNDTIVPNDFFTCMYNEILKHDLDMLQAKHHIIHATHPQGWDGFVKNMKNPAPGIYLNHFIGGSGIIFRRDKVDKIPEVEWALGGWRKFQSMRPELKKGFTSNIEIKLLDDHGYTDYPLYYKETRRI